MTRRRAGARRQWADSLDTDSSLPPLLFLAVSLLLFGWTSVVVAARSTPPSFVDMMAGETANQHRTVWLLRVAAATLAGISVAVFGRSLAEGWIPGADSVWLVAGFIAVSAITATIALTTLDFGIRVLVGLAPDLAARLARPKRWWSDGGPAAYSNGNASGANGNGADWAETDTEGNLPFTTPLTPAELLGLDQYDIDMVRSISRMDDRDASHIMVPSLDVDAVEVSASLATVVDTLSASKHTRLPVYRDTMDDVVGIVHISDVLLALAHGAYNTSLESIMREPEFIAENMAVDDLLVWMRSKSLQMGIVVDEYGGVEGIVTLEDVLEEIVGEIEDEFTTSAADLAAAPDGSWTLNAALPIEDVARAVGVALDYGDVNTIGGHVYSELGRMPTVGDVVRTGDVSIEVTQVRGRRIHQVRLRPANHETAAAQEPGRPAS